MISRILIALCWTLWGALVAGTLYGLVRIVTETSSPEAGPALGILLVGVVLLMLAGAGWWLYRLTKKPSTSALILMMVILLWALVPLVARPIVFTYQEYQHRQMQAQDSANDQR